MTCIYCSGKTNVANSRPQKRSNTVWRRRHCQNCEAIFTSIEQVDLQTSLSVAKDTKRLEAFSRDKLYTSIYDSLKHRKSAVDEATALTETVINQVIRQSDSAIVTQKILTDAVCMVLKRFDSTASVHYQAYYLNK